MVRDVVNPMLILGWPGTSITETDTHSVREYGVCITYILTYLNQYSSLEYMCSDDITHSHCISHGSGRVSGPRDSGSRSTSGNTGEGELRAGSIEVRVHSQYYTTWYGDVSCKG